MPAARCTSSPASGHKRATAAAPAVTIEALVSIRVSSMSTSSAAVTGFIALWSRVPSRSERSAQRPQPGQRGLTAEDPHRLEQGRRDPATSRPDAQRREGELGPVSYTHLRAHETGRNLVCRLLLEKKK